MFKLKRFHSKTVIVIAGILLSAYLILILAVTNLGQSRLKEAQFNELQLKVNSYSDTLSYFFSESKQELDYLANDKVMNTFFANLSSGMSMKYGLGASLFNLKTLINNLIVESKIENLFIYDQIALVGFGKNMIINTEQSLIFDLNEIPFIEMQQRESKTIVVATADGLKIKLLRTVYWQNKPVALLVASLNSELIKQHVSAQEYAGSRSRLQLNTPQGDIFVWDSITGKKDIGSSLHSDLSNTLHIEKNIKGTQFKLVSWFDIVNDQDILTSGWFIVAISLLALPVLHGLFWLMRIDHRNIVLQTEIESSSKRRHSLALKNSLLKNEVKKRQLSERKLAYQATHDALTGLANRTYSYESLQQALDFSVRAKTEVLIMFIDLDNFKHINDTLGHYTGDQVLKLVSKRLLSCVRNTDTVARLGGDEFLLIIPDVADNKAAQMLASKILAVFDTPFELEAQQLFLSTSIGMAISPQDGKNINCLLKSADIALYRVKDEGRNGFSFYEPSMNDDVERNLLLNSYLRLAISENELEMFYQPIINLQTGHIIGAEALMRWNNAELGFISPDEFIPLAEKNGLIHQLGEFALQQACQKAALWQSIYPVQIAVNVSSVQFRYCDELLKTIQKSLNYSGLSADKLEIEVTESLLVNQGDELSSMLEHLRELGIKTAIDDFGTGYSSLSYLQKFNFYKLKIDKVFIDNLATNSADASLVTAIIAMAKALNLKVVAEGIEEISQATCLKALNCDYGQGYLFAKPVRAEEFKQLLMKDRAEK